MYSWCLTIYTSFRHEPLFNNYNSNCKNRMHLATSCQAVVTTMISPCPGYYHFAIRCNGKVITTHYPLSPCGDIRLIESHYPYSYHGLRKRRLRDRNTLTISLQIEGKLESNIIQHTWPVWNSRPQACIQRSLCSSVDCLRMFVDGCSRIPLFLEDQTLKLISVS